MLAAVLNRLAWQQRLATDKPTFQHQNLRCTAAPAAAIPATLTQGFVELRQVHMLATFPAAQGLAEQGDVMTAR